MTVLSKILARRAMARNVALVTILLPTLLVTACAEPPPPPPPAPAQPAPPPPPVRPARG